MYAAVFRGVPDQISNIALWGSHRRFVVARMGSTGSTWLAHLLNSHPDVAATHEQILARVFPKRSYNSDDLVQLIRLMATDTMHGAYLAAGDVGSVWAPHLLALRGKFTTALLVRHPARSLNTRLRTYPSDQSFTEIPTWVPGVVRELWDIDTEKMSPLDRIFVLDLATFAAQSCLLGRVDAVLRIEDLQELEYCRDALWRLTGLRYPAMLIVRASHQRVNTRTPRGTTIREILSGFTPSQRHWYYTMLRDAAPLFEYDLDEDGAAAPRAPRFALHRT